MVRSNDITNFTEFRAHLRDHLEQRKTTGRPLFVTRNGETEAVVLSPSAFDELMDQAELAKSLALLDRSMEDVRAGRGQPLKQAIRESPGNLG
jgi:prevent-host-death family protein